MAASKQALSYVANETTLAFLAFPSLVLLLAVIVAIGQIFVSTIVRHVCRRSTPGKAGKAIFVE